MARYVGTWLYDTKTGLGDTTKLLRLDIHDNAGQAWGTAVANGWTPKLRLRIAGLDVPVAHISGAWEDTPNSAALFSIMDESTIVFEAGTTHLYPVLGGLPIEYEAMLVIEAPGATDVAVIGVDGQAEWFAFTVKRWP
jgi:hypothetical protein